VVAALEGRRILDTNFVQHDLRAMNRSIRRNITITLDEGTARWVRVEAAKKDISVSRYLAEVLAESRKRAEGYEAARERFIARPPRPLRAPGDPLPTRAELYDRGRGAQS
jgi:hypothetical protein